MIPRFSIGSERRSDVKGAVAFSTNGYPERSSALRCFDFHESYWPRQRSICSIISTIRFSLNELINRALQRTPSIPSLPLRVLTLDDYVLFARIDELVVMKNASSPASIATIITVVE